MKFRFIAIQLVILNVLMFVLQIAFRGFTEIFVLNERAFFEPWRFVTAIFLHGGTAHILYNMFALALFGSILEGLIGNRKFLLIYFSSGIIANILAVFYYPSSLGASGAIFGVIGALAVVSPMMVVWAFGLPMPMFVAGILWGLGDFIGLFNPNSSVGHIAHLSGMFVGLFLGLFFRTATAKRGWQKVKLNEDYMRRWEDHYLK